jgi:hypothetical protein
MIIPMIIPMIIHLLRSAFPNAPIRTRRFLSPSSSRKLSLYRASRDPKRFARCNVAPCVDKRVQRVF